MKKKSFLIVLLLCLGVGLWAAEVKFSEPFPWRIWGYVPPVAALTVELNQNSLPFDVDNPDATRNDNENVVWGILAGKYSLLCNMEGFQLTVTHDNLVNKDYVGSEHQKEIGYRLDVYDSSENALSFKTIKTTLSQTEASQTWDIGKLSGNSNTWGMHEKSFYVSLNWEGDLVNDDPRGDLAPGLYTSTITFEVTSPDLEVPKP